MLESVNWPVFSHFTFSHVHSSAEWLRWIKKLSLIYYFFAYQVAATLMRVGKEYLFWVREHWNYFTRDVCHYNLGYQKNHHFFDFNIFFFIPGLLHWKSVSCSFNMFFHVFYNDRKKYRKVQYEFWSLALPFY